jgi:hypothetical protein
LYYTLQEDEDSQERMRRVMWMMRRIKMWRMRRMRMRMRMM